MFGGSFNLNEDQDPEYDNQPQNLSSSFDQNPFGQRSNSNNFDNNSFENVFTNNSRILSPDPSEDILKDYIKELQLIYNQQIEVKEKFFYENESEQVLNSYLLTSSKIENSFLILSNVFNCKKSQTLKRALNDIQSFKNNDFLSLNKDKEDNINDLAVNDHICNLIEFNVSTFSRILQRKIYEAKIKAFSNIVNKAISQKYDPTLMNEDFRNKTKLQEAKSVNIEMMIEEENQKAQCLQEVAGERDKLLYEVKHAEQERTKAIAVNSKGVIKERSQEMMQIDKELIKFERDNREFKVKLEKKEKEVRKFMTEMNRILLHYDEGDSKGQKLKGDMNKIMEKKTRGIEVDLDDKDFINNYSSSR